MLEATAAIHAGAIQTAATACAWAIHDVKPGAGRSLQGRAQLRAKGPRFVMHNGQSLQEFALLSKGTDHRLA